VKRASVPACSITAWMTWPGTGPGSSSRSRCSAPGRRCGWRGSGRTSGPFDLITELPPGTDLGSWERAGLTWAVTFFGRRPTEAEVRSVIDAGPA
jgi:hypothetical protein